MDLRKIQDVKDELRGARVLCRVDFNVPVKESGIVMSDFRIKASLPTISFLQDAGAKIILLAHMGRGTENSLLPVANYLKQNLGLSVKFLPALFGESIEQEIDLMEEGDIVLLENLRTDDGETSNSPIFTKMLAEYGDMYVNDAFAVSHREHASIVGLPGLLPSFAGLRLQEEIENLSLENLGHPVLAVLGGKKFETKAPLVEKFIETSDKVYVCGALAHDVYTARGYEIGISLHGEPAAPEIANHEKVIVPRDVLVENGARDVYKSIEDVSNNDNIVDIGSRAVEDLIKLAEESKTVIWNGPLGRRDIGTEKFLDALAGHSGRVVIGGGDTVALIEKMGLLNEFSFVSTGGGAMLKFLEKGTLVGIEKLKESL
jgi:phosphoglycerate kinase